MESRKIVLMKLFAEHASKVMLKILQAKGVEKRKPSYTVGGNAN